MYVVDVKRTDWLKFATGLITPDFWSSELKPTNPSFNWYLNKVRDDGHGYTANGFLLANAEGLDS